MNELQPTFLIIGGRRCGTNWLQECLIEHPEVYVPPGRHADETLTLETAVGYTGQPAVGLVDATWLTRAGAAGALAARYPRAHFIAVLRNPVERAYSWYLQISKAGDGLYARPVSFEEAIVEDPSILEEGFYYRHLLAYRQALPPGRLHVFLFDALHEDPASYLRQIFTLLDVDPAFRPSVLNEKINYSTHLHSRSLHQFLRLSKRSLLKASGNNQWLVHRLETSRIVQFVRRLNEKPYGALDPATAQRLYRAYTDDIARLSDLIGKDLRHWLPATPPVHASRTDGRPDPYAVT